MQVAAPHALPDTGDVADPGRLDIAALPAHRPFRAGLWASGLLGLAALAALVQAFANGAIGWGITGHYLFWPAILWGLVNTVWLSLACMGLGLAIGLAVALMRDSANPLLRGAAIGYQWLFRGTPIILQILIWYNLALVFPVLGIPGVFEYRTVDVMTPAMAALIGLGLNEGAYASEILRGGLMAVDRGQSEAAMSLGMSPARALWRITLPQALRVVIPPLGNEFISLVKMTSLASIVGFADLLRRAQDIYFTNASVIELLLVSAFWYLAVVTLLTLVQGRLEKRLGRGFATEGRR